MRTRSFGGPGLSIGCQTGEDQQGEGDSVSGIRGQSAIPFDHPDQVRGGHRRGERGHGADRQPAGLTPADSPFREADPLETDRPEDDRQGDRAGEQVRLVAGEPAHAGRGQRGSVAGNTRDQGRGLCDPEREPVFPVGFTLAPGLGGQVGQGHRRRAEDQAGRGRPGPAELRLDNALEAITEGGRRQEGEEQNRGPAQVELADLGADLSAPGDQQGQGRATVQSDLETLAKLGIEFVRIPFQKPRQHRQMGGTRDRQQFGRTLNQPEDHRVASCAPAVAGT